MSYVYWLIFGITFLLAALAERHPKACLLPSGKTILRPDPGAALILSLVLIMTAALRYRVGTDYMAYYRWSTTPWSSVWQSLTQLREAGFQALVNISRVLISDPQAVVFASAVVTVGLYCLMLYRYSPLYLVGMLLYLFLGDWQGSFNGVRQYLAAAILFAGHRFIFERKLVKYLLIVLAASLFHFTAIVMIVPYFILTRKAGITQLVLMAGSALIIRFSYEYIFEFISKTKGILISSIGEYSFRNVNPLRILTAFIPVALYYFACRKDNTTDEQSFYVNALIVNAFAMLAGIGSAYLARIGLYTGAMVSIGYGHVFQMIPQERTRKITEAVILAVLMLYWLYSLHSDGDFRWIFER